MILQVYNGHGNDHPHAYPVRKVISNGLTLEVDAKTEGRHITVSSKKYYTSVTVPDGLFYVVRGAVIMPKKKWGVYGTWVEFTREGYMRYKEELIKAYLAYMKRCMDPKFPRDDDHLRAAFHAFAIKRIDTVRIRTAKRIETLRGNYEQYVADVHPLIYQ